MSNASVPMLLPKERSPDHLLRKFTASASLSHTSADGPHVIDSHLGPWEKLQHSGESGTRRLSLKRFGPIFYVKAPGSDNSAPSH